MDFLFTIVQIIHIMVCLFLMLVVLLQQGKGGGLGAAFGGGAAAQVFGGRGAGNILTRATAICATIFMLTSVGLAYHSSAGDRALRQKAAAESLKRKSSDKGSKRGEKDPKKDDKPAGAGTTKPETPAPAPTDSK